MKKMVESIDALIGQTPLLKLNRSLVGVPGLPSPLQSTLCAKIEFFNPGSSVKDRIAKYIIDQAEARQTLKPGGTIIEATSGNTGAGLAVLAAARGYKAILVVPDKMSSEKINALRAFGAKVIIAPAKVEPTDPRYYVCVATKIAKETPNSILVNQYHNPDNPESHYRSTGPEIWEQMEGNIDVFVGGIGTGGTLSGCARYLKQKNPNIRIVAVDPQGSIYAGLIKTGKVGEAHPYLVEGIGEDMVAGAMDLKLPTDVISVDDKHSFCAARWLAEKEGLLIGGSSGAAFWGALQFLSQYEAKEKRALRAVVLFPDSGSRYLSKVFNSQWLAKNQMVYDWNGNKSSNVEYWEGSVKVEGVE